MCPSGRDVLLTRFDDQEKLVARGILERLILKHTANQLSLAKMG